MKILLWKYTFQAIVAAAVVWVFTSNRVYAFDFRYATYPVAGVFADPNESFLSESSGNLSSLLATDFPGTMVGDTIPKGVKVSREGRRPLPALERHFLLKDLAQGTEKTIFQAPPCLEGEYYVGFQLFYDLGNQQTQATWTAGVELALLDGTTTLWVKPLQVQMNPQTFISTIFHDTTLFCKPEYRFAIRQKTITGLVPQDNVYLKVLLFKVQKDSFNPATPLSLTYSYSGGQTLVSWTYPQDGAIAYDVDWVFIADHEGFSGTAQQAFAFKEPAGITTAGQYYQHLTYYPKGRIWYRARAIGYNPLYPEHRLIGQWFYGSGTPLVIVNHEPGKNWQSQTVFAEEGKYKKTMVYADGTFRLRQSLTNLSTEALTLVGETLYDYEGRSAVEVLAVPATDASLGYKSGFHIFQAGDATVSANTSAIRKKFHYDNHRLPNSILSNQAGAGKYYSPANTLASVHKDYIPDGKGYVYSQSEFVRDGTGRVARQSGVGESFRMDGTHVNRYAYGEAAPAELIRLFGSNVGEASHYKKNLAVDGNAQVSVSYMDQQDRVIASALAGDAPSNVAGLDSYTSLPTAPITVDLRRKNRITNGVSQTEHKLLNVSLNTSYTFRYQLSALAMDLGALGCQTCRFDLKITLTDPEGQVVNLASAPGNQSPDGLSYERKNLSAASCSSPALTDLAFTLSLSQLGEYTLTKTLVPQPMSYDELVGLVTTDASVLQKIQAIYDGYPVDSSACAICTDCPEAEAAIDKAIEEVTEKDCSNLYEQILQYYQDKYGQAGEQPYVVPQDSIVAHPLHCQYQLCLKNQESERFEKQVSRTSTWEGAISKGYQNLINIDPFFNNSTQSGYGHKATMQSKLNDVYVATISYDSNGDGQADGSRVYRGTISQVTDPGNTAYYIDANGNASPTGRHILYLDLMGRKQRLSAANYQAELSKQRWALFKSYYQEAKRKTKLVIPAYAGCAAAKQALEQPDQLPQTEAGIIAYGDQNGATSPVSTPELEMSLHSITSACGITLSAADQTAITTHLQTYFNSNRKNFFRLLLKADVGKHASLVAIQTILSRYACSLNQVAVDDPVTCLQEPGNWVVNPSLTPTASTCAADITEGCYPGWGVATGTPNTSPGGGTGTFLIWAHPGTKTSEAIRGSFISPLQAGVKYELCLRYQAVQDGQTFTSGRVDQVYMQLSRSKAFIDAQGSEVTASMAARTLTPFRPAPVDTTGGLVSRQARMAAVTAACLLPGAKYPDPVLIEGQSSPVNNVWQGSNLSNVSAFKDTCIIFTPTQASTYFYFSIMSCTNGVYQAANIKDLVVKRILPYDNSVTFNNQTICLRYDTTNTTLSRFTFKVDWNQEVNKCLEKAAQESQQLIEYAVENLLEEEVSSFYRTYQGKCLERTSEQLNYSFQPKEYHYTLYYYDQAGNLVQTVPPQGVQPLTPAQVTSFLAGNRIEPAHTFLTKYQYNSLKQLEWQRTPDGGESRFWYNNQGQLRLSQNARQAKESSYSYTKYDGQGRMMEVGEVQTKVAIATLVSQLEIPTFPVASTTYVLNDQTRTYYDQAASPVANGFTQQNLRGRVSYTEALDKNSSTKVTAYYSYDIRGNVQSFLQVLPGLGGKRTDYRYDQISGNVNYVFYQYGKPDQLVHRYDYDGDNRITTVYTSSDGFLWNKEATYRYYLHGPVARIELGEYRVQGLDYYYTLQGWIKGMNMPYAADPGKDGSKGSKVGKDAMAYSLGYYQGDYQAITSTVPLADSRDQVWTRLQEQMNHQGFFNGNISWMITDLPKIGQQANNRNKGMQAMLYGYDQLHRLVKSRSLTSYSSTGFATRSATPAAYDEEYRYDANGNLLSLQRRNEQGGLLDNLTYQYYSGSNRLREVKPVQRDTVYSSGAIVSNHKVYRTIAVQGSAFVPTGSKVQLNASENIFIHPDFKTDADFYAHVLDDTEGTFMYDAIGNLIADQDQGIRITWTPYGKIREVRARVDSLVIQYRYDATGNRVEKKVVVQNKTTYTRYSRDAAGNLLAVYQDTTLTEQYLYGSSRLGLYKGGVRQGIRRLGQKQYELSNHLGNVLAVIADNVGMNQDSTWATILSSQDYYPFGLAMRGRTYQDSTAYRYGFNGKEKDEEWNKYDFGARIYDSRIARWLSIDPRSDEFSGWTPYNYSFNNPISFTDPDGESPISIFVKQALKHGIKIAAKEFIEAQIKKRILEYAGKKVLSKAFAKTLIKDADDILTVLDTEWWEFAIELIPIVGDAYGAASLGKKGKELWDRLNKLEKRVEKLTNALDRSREKLRASFGKVAQEYAKKGFQAHHVIPVGVLQKNEYVQDAVEAGWDINGRLNGKMLKEGFHSNHPSYNEWVNESINSWGREFEQISGRAPSGQEVAKYLNNTLLPQLNQTIDRARDIYEKGGKNKGDTLNNFFKSLVSP